MFFVNTQDKRATAVNRPNHKFEALEMSIAVTWQARIQDFRQGRASGVLTPRGALLKIGVFPLKLPENCMI